MESVEALIKELEISHKRNFELKTRSLIRAGGTCDFFLEPNSRGQLVMLVKGLRQLQQDFMVVGLLSNTLFRDGRIRTPLISTGKLKTFRLYGQDRGYADSGCRLSHVANKLSQNGFEGFAGLTGFPATIGGAVYMNASCYGNAISDYIDYVEYLDQDGNLRRMNKEQLQFSWRYSIFHELPKNYVIVSVVFKLKQGDVSVLSHTIEESKQHRLEYQEHRLPNLGSTFATVDIYRSIAKINIPYRVGYFMIRVAILWGGRVFFPNARTKIWAVTINKFTQKYFDLRPHDGVGVSEHTTNCVVNLGAAQATEIIKFVKHVERKIKITEPLEIEIMEDIE